MNRLGPHAWEDAVKDAIVRIRGNKEDFRFVLF